MNNGAPRRVPRSDRPWPHGAPARTIDDQSRPSAVTWIAPSTKSPSIKPSAALRGRGRPTTGLSRHDDLDRIDLRVCLEMLTIFGQASRGNRSPCMSGRTRLTLSGITPISRSTQAVIRRHSPLGQLTTSTQDREPGGKHRKDSRHPMAFPAQHRAGSPAKSGAVPSSILV